MPSTGLEPDRSAAPRARRARSSRNAHIPPGCRLPLECSPGEANGEGWGLVGTAVTIGRRQLLQAALAATLPFGLLACGRKKGPLQVGGLPVTCNLTLPVACMARDAANRAAAAGTPGFLY